MPAVTHVPRSPVFPSMFPTVGTRSEFCIPIVSHSAEWITTAVESKRHQYLFFRSLAFRDVAVHNDQLDHFALLVTDCAGQRLHYSPSPIFVADAVIQL